MKIAYFHSSHASHCSLCQRGHLLMFHSWLAVHRSQFMIYHEFYCPFTSAIHKSSKSWFQVQLHVRICYDLVEFMFDYYYHSTASTWFYQNDAPPLLLDSCILPLLLCSIYFGVNLDKVRPDTATKFQFNHMLISCFAVTPNYIWFVLFLWFYCSTSS